ncbi:response regulator transcription factor [Sphingomonas crusticola]|uniref:response regulator transcription factor n=1 Tax=Sphingomonas crusticola TaxID=1697973 RepID=UPI000E220E4F|nr:response regulator transcription factor [Sphingomonas crusticola]
MRVLVVEDTHDVGEGVVACLEGLGHAVDWARDGADGDAMLSEASYEMMVLDLTLPRMDGITILKRMRARQDVTPVLILTARSAVDDRVDVLDSGADDYLVKPFDFRELQARVRSLMRRNSGGRSNQLTCGDLVFDRATRIVRVGGEPVSLTRRELSLLEILLTRQTLFFSKSQLLDQLFGYGSEPNENAIEVLIARLRRKLGHASIEIHTYRGVGYRISAT